MAARRRVAFSSRWLLALILVGVAWGVQFVWDRPEEPLIGGAAQTPVLASDEERVLDAFERRESGVTVSVAGTVARILPDDRDGDRHQRFILALSNGRTLLVAHNIDLAPRVPVETDDHIALRGQYEWNPEGGVVHWTHHDPARLHEPGWIQHRGRTYE